MKFTLQEIAQLVGAEVEGDGSLEITGLAKIEEGRPGTLSFLANPKYLPYLYSTQASGVLVSKDFVPQQPVQAALLRTADPYSAFTLLLEKAQAMLQQKKGIETPSYISDSATIGEDVYIGAFAYIGPNARIGNHAKIYPNAYIGDYVEIGDHSVVYANAAVNFGCKVGAHCIIHSNSVIGGDGFGFAPQEDGSMKKIPQTGIVRLEDHVEIGAGSTIDRATLGETLLRSGVKIDNLVHIAHNAEIGANTVVAAQSGISGSTKLGRNCMLGGQVGVVGHVSLADRPRVGAQSGVSTDWKEPGKTLRGSPAQDLRQQLKSEAVFRNLDTLAKRLDEIEKWVSNQK